MAEAAIVLARGGGPLLPEPGPGGGGQEAGSCGAPPLTPLERAARRLVGQLLEAELPQAPLRGAAAPAAPAGGAAAAGEEGAEAGQGRRLREGQGQGGEGRPALEGLEPGVRDLLESLVASLQELSQLASEAAAAADQPHQDGAEAKAEAGALEAGAAAGRNATAAAPAAGGGRRRLQQQLPLPSRDGPIAFNLVFSNLFDFALQRGLYYLVPQLGDVAAVLQRYNFLTDLADGLDAPLDNAVNANLFPLPQTDDDVRALLRRFFDDFCSGGAAVSSETVLFEFSAPSLTLDLVPASCPIRRSADTGRNQIIFEECSPAQLVISTTPYTTTGPYYTAAQYSSASCLYEDLLGIDTSLTLGGGSVAFDFGPSVERVDIVPAINQINTDIRGFRGFPDREERPPNTADDVTLSVGDYLSGITGGR
ncbi:MAG: hypothetical protein J3K34DRAFT_526792 [Monoraphidium minutum]|nr:MAG: hypothetical protein J3K34DRAFT_526792 [Monoraphidium minutum]